MKEIAWFTPPVGVGVGYGYTAVSLIEALQDKGLRVSYDTPTPLVHVSFVQPHMYRGTNDQYKIGYTPWESTELPESWLSDMRERDEIWTTSNFCKDVFNSYSVNNVIHMVPHGIDEEVWKIHDRHLSGKFVFLHVGGPTERKGGQKVVDTFLSLYDGNKDYELILKSNGPSEVRWTKNGQYMGNIRNHPQIKVIEAKLETEQLVMLYNKAHCLVYPTNGEGFGCIPFQGIATGLPTICTNATGCADFAEYSIPLDSHPTNGVGIHLGEWVEPSIDHLRFLMEDVVSNYDKHQVNTMASARIIHTTQTWAHIADQVIDIIGDKIEKVV